MFVSLRNALPFCVFALAACHESAGQKILRAPDDRSGYFADPADFFGVYFKPGQPISDEDLLSSLAKNPGDGEKSLRHDLQLILSHPADTRFTIYGFTDTRECKDEQCVDLSVRRARLVHDWLARHGAPVERLNPPYGYGSARPIGDNNTAQGRINNRRVSIEVESIDKSP